LVTNIIENISNFQNKNEKKKERQITATTTDLGIGINGKMVLYLGRFGKSENRD
jgi:hypothetical protein